MTEQDQWIATRAFESAEGRIAIKIGLPEKVCDDEWHCPYSVGGQSSHAHGLDAFQALFMALTGVRAALDNLGMQLKWRGGKVGDHGVPRLVPHGFGVAFSRKIEEFIDSEVNQFAVNAEAAARTKRST
jgi:hypothetical protein